jgi:hypothetical protein
MMGPQKVDQMGLRLVGKMICNWGGSSECNLADWMDKPRVELKGTRTVEQTGGLKDMKSVD